MLRRPFCKCVCVAYRVLCVCTSPTHLLRQTAESINDKIKTGVMDVSNETYGVKLGKQAGAPRSLEAPAASGGGCC